jgi:hypothetical protein
VNLVAVAYVTVEAVLGDHLAHVAADFLGGGDRRAGPRLEAVAEGVQVAVGTDAGVFVREPGAAETFLALQHDEARAGALLRQVIRPTHARDAGTHDQHVEILDGRGHHVVHRVRASVAG